MAACKHEYVFKGQTKHFPKQGPGKVKSTFECTKCRKRKVMTEAQMLSAARMVERNRVTRRPIEAAPAPEPTPAKPTLKLTKRETEMLLDIASSEYGDQVMDAVWSWAVCGTRADSGVMASLVKKGLVRVYESGTEEANAAITLAGVVEMLFGGHAFDLTRERSFHHLTGTEVK